MSAGGPGEALPRRLCATLRSLGSGGCAPCNVAGRVVAVSPADGCFLLMDRSGVLTLRGERLPPAGAIVRVRVEAPAGAAPCARGWTVLTPYRGAADFPPLDGEHYRLQRGVPSRADNLRRRARILAATREFFDRRGFVEVQTPLRVRVAGLEPQLVAERAGDRYLITSPEYHMKRLLAGGLERIYFLGPCFRGEESGRQHLGEFTMLEWYRAHASLDDVRADAEGLLRAAAAALSCGPQLRVGDHTVRLDQPFLRITVAAACAEHAGVDVSDVTGAAELRRRMAAAGFDLTAPETDFDELFSRLLVERVEPALARLGAPVFLCEFPAPLAALARIKADDPTVCERFELYAAGLELANAFGELTDPDEQRARLEIDQRIRNERGAAVYPIDERFIAALREGIPPSAGIALGFDRMVMLLCGAERIADVVAFAGDEV